MAKGGWVIPKKGRRRKPGSKGDGDDDDDDDDGDEEYVLEEEEELESSGESDAASGDPSDDEESFDFAGSSSGDDEIKPAKSKSKSKLKSKPRAISRRGKPRVSDSEEEEQAVPVSRKKAAARSGSRRSKEDSDYEVEDEEEDDDDDFSPDEEEEEEEEEEEVSMDSRRTGGYKRKRGRKKRGKKPRKKRRKAAGAPAKRRRRRSEEDDFIVEDPVEMEKKRKKSKKTRKKGLLGVSESSDSDFVVSDDGDSVVSNRIEVVNPQKKKSKKGRPRKRAAVIDSDSLESDFVASDDYDFVVENRIEVDDQRKKRKGAAGSKRRRKRSGVDSEGSDSDYVVSDDEFVEQVQAGVEKRRKESEMARKKELVTRKRSAVGSTELDLRALISKEEARDLRIEGLLNWRQPKKNFNRRKAEEKGKEKEIDDSGKQVCGICLSEEQKGIVQGLLNCCNHYFCFACIMEWSKVESRCPVCKRRFVTITKSGRSDPGCAMRQAVVRVQKRDQVYQPSEEEIRGILDPYENVVCIECQQGGDDNLMLLCDICDSSAHTYCVGLGREVPEGNWYCECCRSVGDGSSHSQNQDTMTDQGASNGSLFPGGAEAGIAMNMHSGTNSPRPVFLRGQPSLRIDLNVSPRSFASEDQGAASPASGHGASTLSGRRAIHQRIRIMLSSGRSRQDFSRTNVTRHTVESGTPFSESERNRETASESRNPLRTVLGPGQYRQNNTPLSLSPNFMPFVYSEGSGYRHSEGAKD